MVIRKLPNKNKWRLYSSESHRNLGTFNSIKKALDREKQVNFFKHIGKIKAKRRRRL